MTDSLYPASLQKLHELDERARGVPGALFDHLDLADSHAGESGKACSRVTTSLADGAESFGGHAAVGPSGLFHAGFHSEPDGDSISAISESMAFIAAISHCGLMRDPVRLALSPTIFAARINSRAYVNFVVFIVASKGNGAEAPRYSSEKKILFLVAMTEPAWRGIVAGEVAIGRPFSIAVFIKTETAIRSAVFHRVCDFDEDAASESGKLNEHGNLLSWDGQDCPFLCSFFFASDDTLLTHNVHSVKHKVRTNDDLLREAA